MPVEPAPYDLVVESKNGFTKIQVKSAATRTRGKWAVSIGRIPYGQKRMPYLDTDVDYFFIVCGDGRRYLIPLQVVSGSSQLVLDAKYANYCVTDD